MSAKKWQDHFEKGPTKGNLKASMQMEIIALRTALAAATAPVAPQQAVAGDLHNEIMNIACRRADDTFLNMASRMLYKEGHRDARHDAAELVAARAALSAPVAQAEPTTQGIRAVAEPVAQSELTDAQIVAVWQAMPGGIEGWLKQFGFLQFARAILAAVPRDRAAPAAVAESCLWTHDEDCGHSTACGEDFVFNEGGPAENNFKFCHGCGKPVLMDRRDPGRLAIPIGIFDRRED